MSQQHATYRYDLVNCRNIWVSWGAESLFGYSQEELHDMRSEVLAVLLHQDDLHLVEAHHERLRSLTVGQSLYLLCRGWRKNEARPCFLRFIDTCVAHNGRQCTVIEGEVFEISVGMFDARKVLERGLLRQELTLHYQPICDLRTGAVVGYEALARWVHGNVVTPPCDFLPLIEGTALEIPWVRQQVSLIEAALMALPDPIWIALNVSESMLSSETLSSILAGSPCPERLHIELLESASLHKRAIVTELKRLRAMCHLVFADDVGEMESLSRFLANGLFDGIKLDRTLVEGLPDEMPVAVVSKHILSLAAELGLPVIAEWVQTPAQVDWLLAHGCQWGQGALFGLARPLEYAKR